VINRIILILRAIRAPFLTATGMSVVLGGCLAWYAGAVLNWLNLLLCLIGTLSMHAAVNLLNDWFDHRSGLDPANRFPTPFSGGSRVIQQGEVRPRSMLIAGIGALVLTAAIGLYLDSVTDKHVILLIGFIGFFFGWFYTGLPVRIGYTIFAETVTGIGCGPLIVLGTYWTQTSAGFPWVPLLASLPLGILVGLILFANQFPDYPNDKAAGKRHIVCLVGRRTASRIYAVALAGLYLYTAVAIALRIFPLPILAVFLTLPMAWINIRLAWSGYDDMTRFLKVNAGTIGLHMAYSLLLAVGFLTAPFLRTSGG
jgi:1,4-dihydroxy-2-naphthoate octaprenyltransferase